MIRWSPPPQPQQAWCGLKQRSAQCSAQPRQPLQQQASRDAGDSISATSSTPRIGADSDEQPLPSAYQRAETSSNGAHSNDEWSDPGDRNGGAIASHNNGSSDVNGSETTSAATRQPAQNSSSSAASTNGSTAANSTGTVLAEASNKGEDGAAPGVEAEVEVGAAVEVAAALGKSGWDGLPARYKMVVASSVAFMVCNMVRHVGSEAKRKQSTSAKNVACDASQINVPAEREDNSLHSLHHQGSQSSDSVT